MCGLINMVVFVFLVFFGGIIVYNGDFVCGWNDLLIFVFFNNKIGNKLKLDLRKRVLY